MIDFFKKCSNFEFHGDKCPEKISRHAGDWGSEAHLVFECGVSSDLFAYNFEQGDKPKTKKNLNQNK